MTVKAKVNGKDMIYVGWIEKEESAEEINNRENGEIGNN